MKVLVDTCVWSLAFRRTEGATANPNVQELTALISEVGVQMIGPIRQELLSGIRVSDQYRELRDQLRAFSDLPLSNQEFERAAEHYNTCRESGVQGSNTDFLICAVGELHDLSIFTVDENFYRYKELLQIKLHHPRADL